MASRAADPELQSVFPPFGSEVGGTRLLLKSSNAIAQSGVTCVFEASSASQKRKKVVAMPALRVADNAIVCDAPPLPPGSVSVRVKLHEATSSSFVVYNVTGAFAAAAASVSAEHPQLSLTHVRLSCVRPQCCRDSCRSSRRLCSKVSALRSHSLAWAWSTRRCFSAASTTLWSSQLASIAHQGELCATCLRSDLGRCAFRSR